MARGPHLPPPNIFSYNRHWLDTDLLIFIFKEKEALWTVCATCHVHTFYVCFPRSPQGFPLQAFLELTSHEFYRNFCSACAVTVVIFRHFRPNRSFFTLLHYILLYFTELLLWKLLFWSRRCTRSEVSGTSRLFRAAKFQSAPGGR